MEQIIIKIKDKKKAKTLLDFLNSLDFIESVIEKDLSIEKASADGENDFFSMAGLWAGRNVTLQSIREQAWPYRA